jgi:hypothetical protein
MSCAMFFLSDNSGQPMTNNVPIYNPLFPPSMEYGSEDAESVSVLVEVDEIAVRNLLKPTQFFLCAATLPYGRFRLISKLKFP